MSTPQSRHSLNHPTEARAWDKYHLWYQASAHEVHTTAVALGLIGEISRLGMHVLTLPALPADGDPDYITAVLNRAQRRNIRVVPDVSNELLAERGLHLDPEARLAIIDQWFDAGALGIELRQMPGSNCPPETTELISQVRQRYPDALISANVQANTFAEVDGAGLENLDAISLEIFNAPALEGANYEDQTLSCFDIFAKARAIPAWNCSAAALDVAAKQLSEGAVLLADAFLPGILHFEQNIPGRAPSTRHALRMRDALGLYRKNLVLETSQHSDGFIWLIGETLAMLINFGPYEYLVPKDQVVMSSLIALPERDNQLVIPAGEAAWLLRS